MAEMPNFVLPLMWLLLLIAICPTVWVNSGGFMPLLPGWTLTFYFLSCVMGCPLSGSHIPLRRTKLN